MADTILGGCVNSDGSIYSGTGFDVDYQGGGIYIITYDTQFSQPPAVVLTQNFQGWNNFGYGGGSTLDNCVLIASDRFKFKVITGGGAGQGTDRNFSFIAIGPA